MQEIWKDIPNCKGMYQVSNLGNVRSFSNKKNGDLLKLSTNKHGYYTVCIKGKNVLVHRLVAIAFIPNPDNYNVVNHKDENKLNNNINNLEWCTSQYNFDYKTARLRQAISQGKPVEQLTLDNIPIATYYSSACASFINGCDDSSIHKCCLGKRKTAGGYKWRYLDK